MGFPSFEQATEQVTKQVPEQVLKLLKIMGDGASTANELIQLLEIKHRPTFLYNYLQPSIEKGYVKMTIPEKPQSSKQKYILTEKGKNVVV
jgi:ATP-dependent DNA helicase RecG